MQSYPLKHFNARPAGILIDTIVIHSMYDPAAQGNQCYDTQSCIRLLDFNKVAAHYAISPDGQVYKLVEELDRAWHAGESKMPFPDDKRENVNDFSIGIELVGSENFSAEQYKTLGELTVQIISRHPISKIVGHQDIAPQRKADPGENFDWKLYRKILGEKIDLLTLQFVRT